MKELLIKTLLVVGVTFMFTGCGYTSLSVVKKSDYLKSIGVDGYRASADVDNYDFMLSGTVKRTNMKYAFAFAAQKTVNEGYKYFRIINASRFLDYLREEKADTMEKVYEACDSGDESFAYLLSLHNWVRDSYACDTPILDWKETVYVIRYVGHRTFGFNFTMTNDAVEMAGTYDAQKILNSPMIQELDQEEITKYINPTQEMIDVYVDKMKSWNAKIYY